jgi:16S rRNA A1518/A1519 N6-dimethyltransferase RsmA/KsgA/DIM1 with predicted DNA glycosylase/AP lyase activity
MLDKIINSIKSVFTREPEVVDAVVPITKSRKKTDRSKLTSFQVAAGYAALMKYQQDKLAGNTTHATLEEMYAELNQRLGTNKSRSAWTVAITKYMRSLEHKGE